MIRLIDITARSQAIGCKKILASVPQPHNLKGGCRLVVTVATGDVAYRISKFSIPFMQFYAKKFNADFICIDGEIINKEYPVFDKFMLSYVSGYESVMFLDADIILNPTSPNFFEIVPDGKLGLFSIDEYLNVTNLTNRYISEIRMLASLQGVNDFVSNRLFNSGFVVGSGDLVSKFFAAPVEPVSIMGPWHEEQWCNININRFSIGTYNLPLNSLWMQASDVHMEQLDFDVNMVVHFSGMYGNFGWREKMMRLCYLLLKNQIIS